MLNGTQMLLRFQNFNKLYKKLQNDICDKKKPNSPVASAPGACSPRGLKPLPAPLPASRRPPLLRKLKGLRDWLGAGRGPLAFHPH